MVKSALERPKRYVPEAMTWHCAYCGLPNRISITVLEDNNDLARRMRCVRCGVLATNWNIEMRKEKL